MNKQKQFKTIIDSTEHLKEIGIGYDINISEHSSFDCLNEQVEAIIFDFSIIGIKSANDFLKNEGVKTLEDFQALARGELLGYDLNLNSANVEYIATLLFQEKALEELQAIQNKLEKLF